MRAQKFYRNLLKFVRAQLRCKIVQGTRAQKFYQILPKSTIYRNWTKFVWAQLCCNIVEGTRAGAKILPNIFETCRHLPKFVQAQLCCKIVAGTRVQKICRNLFGHSCVAKLSKVCGPKKFYRNMPKFVQRCGQHTLEICCKICKHAQKYVAMH